MRFDLGSFISGALIAFVVSFAAYKRRAQLSALWQKIRARLAALQNQLTAGVEQRYRTSLLAYCDQLVLTNGQADFDAIYVAQHLDPPRRGLPSTRLSLKTSGPCRSPWRCAAPGAWLCWANRAPGGRCC